MKPIDVAWPTTPTAPTSSSAPPLPASSGMPTFDLILILVFAVVIITLAVILIVRATRPRQAGQLWPMPPAGLHQ